MTDSTTWARPGPQPRPPPERGDPNPTPGRAKNRARPGRASAAGALAPAAGQAIPPGTGGTGPAPRRPRLAPRADRRRRRILGRHGGPAVGRRVGAGGRRRGLRRSRLGAGTGGRGVDLCGRGVPGRRRGGRRRPRDGRTGLRPGRRGGPVLLPARRIASGGGRSPASGALLGPVGRRRRPRTGRRLLLPGRIGPGGGRRRGVTGGRLPVPAGSGGRRVRGPRRLARWAVRLRLGVRLGRGNRARLDPGRLGTGPGRGLREGLGLHAGGALGHLPPIGRSPHRRRRGRLRLRARQRGTAAAAGVDASTGHRAAPRAEHPSQGTGWRTFGTVGGSHG